MNISNDMHSKNHWSIRSLSTFVALIVCASFALTQYQHNRQLRRQVESLSSEIKALNAYDDELRVKVDRIIDIVSDEPRLTVQDVLHGNTPRNSGG